MKSRTICGFLTLCIAMWPPPIVRGDANASPAIAFAAFLSIRTLAADSQRQFPNNDDIREIAGNLSATSTALREKWAAGTKDGTLDTAYLATLQRDASLIAESSGTKDATKAIEILTDVREDLDAKLTFASTTQVGLSDAFIPSAEVTVTTFVGNAERSGFIVNCNTRRHSSDPRPMFPFNNPSSPTTSQIPPGAYVLWIEDGRGKRLVTRSVRIGLDGQQSISIRVDIPSDSGTKP